MLSSGHVVNELWAAYQKNQFFSVRCFGSGAHSGKKVSFALGLLAEISSTLGEKSLGNGQMYSESFNLGGTIVVSTLA
jgi:hypothetical protein